MANPMSSLPPRQLQTLFDIGVHAALTDGQLLERFTAHSGEASELAFTALVERHGPMVLRTCREVLGEHHEAMDAFQATFFVLANKGRTLWVRDSLAPWLHRVACRKALRANAEIRKRRAAEQASADQELIPPPNEDRDDLVAALHEEVNRLPECFRVPIVLCDLQNLTYEEVAHTLECPVGTIKSRLARGRKRLRDRLFRRGFQSVPAIWFPAKGIDLYPRGLVETTVKAVIRLAPAGAKGGASSGGIWTWARLRASSSLSKVAAATVLVGVGTLAVGFPIRQMANFAGWNAEEKVAQPVAAAADLARQKQAVTRPTQRELADFEDYMGRTEASISAKVVPKVSGVLQKIYVREGQAVKTGDRLFDLDSQPYQAKVDQAKANLDQADARLKRLDANLTLATDLVAKGTIKQEELAPIQGERDEAAPSVASAKAALDLARIDLEGTRVTASADGVVTRVLASAGDLLPAHGSQKPVLELVSLDPIYVSFDMDEQTVLRLRRSAHGPQKAPGLVPGLSVQVGVLALEEDFSRDGKLTAVADNLDPDRGTLRVTASLPNPDSVLIPGISVRVRLKCGTTHKALLVPEQAVLSERDERVLLVVTPRGSVERRTVQVGRVYDGLREVKEGLTAGETVIADPGSLKLGPDSKFPIPLPSLEEDDGAKGVVR